VSWEKVKLGDITDSCLGKMLDQQKNRGEFQPYLANVNVRWGAFDLDDLPQMRFEENEQERYGLRYGDLVVCEGGEPGRCAIWKGQVPNMKIQKALHRVRVHDGLDYRYLYYWFLLAGRRGALDQYFTGATIKHMPGQKLKGVVIDKPSIEIQRRIADILSAYDNLIENNQKQIKLLEEAAQRLYKEWFVRDNVPDGWEQRSLGDVASILRRGISPKYDDNGKYLVISQKCIRQSIMDIREARRESKEYTPELNLQDKDTVICSTGTGTLGRVGQVFGAYPDTTFDSHVTLVRTEQYPNFFYQAIKHQQDFLMGMGRGSTNQQELYRGVIEGLQLLIPTQKILNRAENMLSAIHDKITTLNSQIGLLVEARDRLLPKLMSGEFGGVKNVSLF
jgi:type I restriction enzyme S subunit